MQFTLNLENIQMHQCRKACKFYVDNTKMYENCTGKIRKCGGRFLQGMAHNVRHKLNYRLPEALGFEQGS